MEAGHHFQRNALIAPEMARALHIKKSASNRLNTGAALLVVITEEKRAMPVAYQFSSRRLGISAKSPSSRRAENLEKVALLDM